MCNVESFTCLKEQIPKVGCRTENVAALCQLFFTTKKKKNLASSIHEDDLTIMKKSIYVDLIGLHGLTISQIRKRKLLKLC